MTYLDMTFCPYYLECKKGDKCRRALTPKVCEGAKDWWGLDKEPHISVFAEEPECLVRDYVEVMTDE